MTLYHTFLPFARVFLKKYKDIYNNVEKKYDYIITNPPIRVGKKILYEILIKAKDYLKEDGHLIFVINKDQGAKSTMKDMEEYYSPLINLKFDNNSLTFNEIPKTR